MKTLKQLVFLPITILSLLFTSCILSPSIKGNGDVVEQERNIDDFSELKVSRGMNVYITYGDDTKLMIRADGNLLKVIETEVIGDVLEISSEANIKKAKEKKVFVTTPNLDKLKAFAGSNVYSENTIETGNFIVSASAGSNIKLQLDAKQVEVSASAGSNINLKGKAKSITGKASSGSNIRANELNSSKADCKVSSGANFWVTATNQLMGKASSGGNIFYYGSPENTEIHKSSGGNVIKN